jgi:hypothetical protein
MLWFFERDDQTIEVETRFDNGAGDYVVIVRRPDGRSDTHRCPDAASFQTWLRALDQELQADHWHNNGLPVFLPDGWPEK